MPSNDVTLDGQKETPETRRNSVELRAGPQHDFVVANMFGPIDWDHDLLMKEKEVRPQVESPSPSTRRSTEGKYPLSEGSKSDTERDKFFECLSRKTATSKPSTPKQPKSTFERGAPLCEANMFGPMDWALELLNEGVSVDK